MATKQGLYAQVFMIRHKNFNISEENENNKNENKVKFQSQSEKSHCLFDVDFDWTLENFSTHEPNFYKKIYQRHDETQDKNTFSMFAVPIKNSKNVEERKFHIDAPMLKHRKKHLK